MSTERERIDELLQSQKAFFADGKTLPLAFRLDALKRLRNEIISREDEIVAALRADLGKSRFESYMCEIGMTLSEISYMQKHLASLSRPKRVKTPMAQFRSHSYTLDVPFGNVLIISPWNYPFLLTLSPLVNAVAAGNTALIKPSTYSPNTTSLLASIVSNVFDKKHVALIEGGIAKNGALLDQKYDFVFFTGSTAVGREVLRKCAENLTPAVLELGGKSPCIVDDTAKIELAARRIIFGKLINSGQTCVAPDYILCHSSIKESLVEALKREIVRQYTSKPLTNESYCHIVNEKHFNRLLGLIDESKVVHGGEYDRSSLRIAPTIIDNADWSDTVMQEEIFGPILPILTYQTNNELISLLNGKQKPLALYLFSEDKNNISLLTHRLQFGGGCINDTIIHLATSEMGFGGVGESGMGAYHGKVGFECFSHKKSIVNKATWLDMPMRYAPYSDKNLKRVKQFLK